MRGNQKVKYIKLLTLIFIICFSSPSYSEEDSLYPRPAIRSLIITAEDIAIHLGLNIYKYEAIIPPEYSVDIILEDKTQKERIFTKTPEITKDLKYKIKVTFTSKDNILTKPFKASNEWVSYEINWNGKETFSGSFINFMKGYPNHYYEVNANSFAEKLMDYYSIVKFYRYNELDEVEEFAAELYLKIDKKTINKKTLLKIILANNRFNNDCHPCRFLRYWQGRCLGWLLQSPLWVPTC